MISNADDAVALRQFLRLFRDQVGSTWGTSHSEHEETVDTLFFSENALFPCLAIHFQFMGETGS